MEQGKLTSKVALFVQHIVEYFYTVKELIFVGVNFPCGK